MENTCEKSNSPAVFPVDSRGRRIATIKNFSAYTDKMLSATIEDLGLFMSVTDLNFCREHYARHGVSNITLSEIYMLDELIKASRNTAANSAVTELLTDNTDLRETYCDLYEKYQYLCGENTRPLSLEKAANVCSSYLYKIGAYDKSEKAARKLSAEKKLTLKLSQIADNTAFSLITPTVETDDYNASVLAFMSDSEVESLMICARRIDSCGIAAALADMADGIYADLYSIPEMPEQRELSDLVSACHTRVIIATQKQVLPELTAIAERYGLSLSYFAKAVQSDKLTLSNPEGRRVQIDTSLIRALRSSLVGQVFDLCGEAAKYFYHAANTVVSAILPIIALGTDRASIRLNTIYRLPKMLCSAPLGGSLATVLGAYRVMCELCLPDMPKIEYSDDVDIDFDATAYLSNNGEHIGDKFRTEGSYVYLLSFDRTESGLPNFASLRAMCDFYRGEVVAGKVRSAKAIDGTPIEAIEKMEGICRFSAAENNAGILVEKIEGLIVETSEPQKFGILLGKLAPNSENEAD